MPDYRDVDPRELRLPSSRRSGADWIKLQRQIGRHGSSTTGMPAILVREGSDGVLLIVDGVTRATRVSKLLPGSLVRVQVIDRTTRPFAALPKVGENLP